MADAAYQQSAAGFTARVGATEDEERDGSEQERPTEAVAKLKVQVDGRFRDQAFCRGYAQGCADARETIGKGSSVAFDIALYLQAVGDVRGILRTRAEGRFTGYIEELERALDAFYEAGYRMNFSGLDQRALSDELYKAAYSVRSDALAPMSTNAVLACVWPHFATKPVPEE